LSSAFVYQSLFSYCAISLTSPDSQLIQLLCH